MPFDPTGNFTRVHNWQQDRDNGIRILADRHDEEDDNFAQAFNQVFLRNGLIPMTNDLNMGGHAIHSIKAGSVASPSLTWEMAPNTGFFQPSDDAIAFSSKGVQKFIMNSAGAAVSGDFGVTGYFLTPIVKDGIFIKSANPFIHFMNIANDETVMAMAYNITNDIFTVVSKSHIGFLPNGVERMRLAFNGNIGMGTTNPQSNLHVKGSDGQILLSTDGDTGALTHFVSSGVVYMQASSGTSGGLPYRPLVAIGSELHLAVGSSGTALYVSPQQNVAIGSIGPVARLHVSVPDGTMQFGVNGTTKGIRFVCDQYGSNIEGVDNTLGASHQNLTVSGADLTLTSQNGIMHFFNGGLERMSIYTNGKIGIGGGGVDYPSRLHVSDLANSPAHWVDSRGFTIGESTYNPNYYVKHGTFIPAGRWTGFVQNVVANAAGPYVINPEGANVGVATYTPDAQFQVGGTGEIRSMPTLGGNPTFALLGGASNMTISSSTTNANIIFTDNGNSFQYGRFEGGAFYIGVPGAASYGHRTITINAGSTGQSSISFCEGGAIRTNMFYHPQTIQFYIDTDHHTWRTAQGVSFMEMYGNRLIPLQPSGSMLLGADTNLWHSVWAATGTIQTSDARAKEWRGGLSPDELAAAKAIAQGIGAYRWLDTNISDKLHIGVLAQEVIAKMEAQGLDALSYGFVMYNEWEATDAIPDEPEVPEHKDKDGKTVFAVPAFKGRPGREAGNSYSVNYAELSMFIAAAQEQRLSALEV
jgi:hypothetical protein